MFEKHHTPGHTSRTAACDWMMSPPVAFVTAPLTLFTRSTRFSQCAIRRSTGTSVNSKHRIRVCATTDKTADSTALEEGKTTSEGRKLSKSEEMAALLGQDVGELKRKAEKQKQDLWREKRGRILMALASMGIAGFIFWLRKNDPDASLNLMKFLAETSAPVEVVGTNGKPTFVEFSATWCTNCKVMSKRVFELEQEYGDRVNFVVVDGDDPSRSEMVEKFGVDGVPQFSMVSTEGEVRGNLIGLVPKEALQKDLDALINGEGLPFPGVSLQELRNIGLD